MMIGPSFVLATSAHQRPSTSEGRKRAKQEPHFFTQPSLCRSQPLAAMSSASAAAKSEGCSVMHHPLGDPLSVGLLQFHTKVTPLSDRHILKQRDIL